jgi:hypothetical protein
MKKHLLQGTVLLMAAALLMLAGCVTPINFSAVLSPGGSITSHLDFFLPLPDDGSSGSVTNAHLEVTSPGYEGWLTGSVPASYPSVATGSSVPFDAVITVPPGTAPGFYIFKLSVLADEFPVIPPELPISPFLFEFPPSQLVGITVSESGGLPLRPGC